MNVRGRDVLIGAAIDGIGQLRGQPADGRGRFSATGLLFDRVGCPHLLMAPDKSALPEQQAAHERCKRKVKRRFGFSQTDLMTVDRLNDSLGADFLSIAWILSGGVDLSTKPPVSDTVSLTSGPSAR